MEMSSLKRNLLTEGNMNFKLVLAKTLFVILLAVNSSTISLAKAPAPESFGTLPAIHDAAISPDGKEYAAITNREGQYLIWVASLDGEQGKPRLISLGEGVKPDYIKWVNDGRIIVSLWQSEITNGLPLNFGYLYTLDAKTMKGKILINPQAPSAERTTRRLRRTGEGVLRQFNNIVVDWLENDPKHILMSYDELSNNLHPALYRVNVKTGHSVRVKRSITGVQKWYTDNNGNPRAGQGRMDTNDASWVLKIKDATDGKWRESKDYPGLEGDTKIHGFTSNADEMIIGAYQGQNTIGLYIYNLQSKSITRKLYHNDKYDSTGVELSNDGKHIVGAHYIADKPKTELLGDYDSNIEVIRDKLKGYTVDFIDQDNEGNTIIVKVSNPYDPGVMLLFRAEEREYESLGKLYPDLPPEEMGDVINVKYGARDGYGIPAYVTLPPKITETSQLNNLPFIVLPHGGPYGRDTKRFDYFAQFFASRGYGVLQMNFRGSEGYGKEFREAGRKNWVIMQEDVEDGARWLLKKGYADPKRLCIAGWSYGGYASLMGAAKNGDMYSCAVAMGALTDIADFKRDMRKYRFGYANAKHFISSGFENKDDIQANSPVKIAQDIKIPLFLAHGTKDQRVHFDQYKRMKRALKKGSAKVTYMEFKGEDHFLSGQENRQNFFKGLDKFLIQANGKSEYMN